MSFMQTILTGTLLLAFLSPAVAQLDEARLKAILADSKKPDHKKLAEVRAMIAASERRSVMRTRPAAAGTLVAAEVVPPRARFNVLNKNTPSARAAALAAAVEAQRFNLGAGVAAEQPRELLNPECAGFTVLLRRDWKDIGTLACPRTTADANGAELSFAYDGIARNQIWTARGTAAVAYSSLLDSPGAYYKSFAAYVTANRVINSAPAVAAKGDSDKLAFGVAGELGVQTERAGSHFFRLRGGAVEDRLKNTSSGNVTAEWTPVYDDGVIRIHSPIPVFNDALILRFDPSLLVQYASVAGGGVLDFNGRKEALRIGPQLVMRIMPGTAIEGSFLSRFSGQISYHWAYETYSRRGISLLDSAITYNIDPDGQFGITGSYKRGRDEDTGTLTDIYKIALTGKI